MAPATAAKNYSKEDNNGDHIGCVSVPIRCLKLFAITLAEELVVNGGVTGVVLFNCHINKAEHVQYLIEQIASYILCSYAVQTFWFQHVASSLVARDISKSVTPSFETKDGQQQVEPPIMMVPQSLSFL
jgi:hypothetical protein